MLCPTIAPADVEALAADLAAQGLHAIDAPMSGGPVRAREGRMSLMVATPDAVFERWQPVLQRLADPVFRVGTRPGDGARTKLVNNLLAAINLAGAAEVLAVATRLGLDPSTTLDVMERSSGQSWIATDRLRRALADRREPLAHMTACWPRIQRWRWPKCCAPAPRRPWARQRPPPLPRHWLPACHATTIRPCTAGLLQQ